MDAAVLNPVGFARQRFRQWWQSRLPLSDTTTLTQRNVYILPTRPGFMMGLTLLLVQVHSLSRIALTKYRLLRCGIILLGSGMVLGIVGLMTR